MPELRLLAEVGEERTGEFLYINPPFRYTDLIFNPLEFLRSFGFGKIFAIAPIARPPSRRCLGTRPETHIHIHTPLIHPDKAGIIRLGLELKAPLELTWSRYRSESRSCGSCSSCRLHLKGFAAVGVPDPILYQDQE